MACNSCQCGSIEIDNLPIKAVINCARGKSLGPIPITIKNPVPPYGDGLPADLTGCILRGHVRKTFLSSVYAVTFTTEILSQTLNRGKATFGLTPAQTAALGCGERATDLASRYVYDLELEDTLGNVHGLLSDTFIVSPEATR